MLYNELVVAVKSLNIIRVCSCAKAKKNALSDRTRTSELIATVLILDNPR